ncbi:MAG: glycosyltransferase [Planctomycetota bacterium]
MSQSDTQVAVVIVNRDDAPTLERAICSALDQEGPGVEVWVMDGGSSDGSVDLIREYRNELAGWSCAWDAGPGDAATRAIDRTDADLVTVLSSRDVLAPGALEDAAWLLDREDGAGYAFGPRCWIDEHDEVVERGADPARPTVSGLFETLGGDVPSAGVFYRRELFDCCGGFDPRLQHAYRFAWHAALSLGNVRAALSPSPWGLERAGSSQRTVRETIERGEEHLDVLEALSPSLPKSYAAGALRSVREQRAVYAAAREESQASARLAGVWRHLLRRPHWLNEESYRERLLQSVAAQNLSQHLRNAA